MIHIDFESWYIDHTDDVFYMWIKSGDINRPYLYQKADTVKISSITALGFDYLLGIKKCDTCGRVYSEYEEFYTLSEIRLGLPDFDYENLHERGDIK